jgi:hypothetical protein
VGSKRGKRDPLLRVAAGPWRRHCGLELMAASVFLYVSRLLPFLSFSSPQLKPQSNFKCPNPSITQPTVMSSQNTSNSSPGSGNTGNRGYTTTSSGTNSQVSSYVFNRPRKLVLTFFRRATTFALAISAPASQTPTLTTIPTRTGHTTTATPTYVEIV